MKQQEAIEQIKALVEKNSDEYRFFGVRFDSKKYEVGQYAHLSKSNINRLDAREFPEFESEEYNGFETLSGTCAYDAEFWMDYIDVEDDDEYHIHLIAGENYEEGEDRDEMIIEDAKVLMVIK